MDDVRTTRLRGGEELVDHEPVCMCNADEDGEGRVCGTSFQSAHVGGLDADLLGGGFDRPTTRRAKLASSLGQESCHPPIPRRLAMMERSSAPTFAGRSHG